MVTFGSQEEAMEAARSGDTDREVINAIISGDYQISEQEEQSNTDEQPQVQQMVETDDAEDESVEDSSNSELSAEERASQLFETERAKLLEEQDLILKEKDLELEELRRIKRESEEQINVVEEAPIIVEDENSDLASSYEKDTRLLLKQVSDKLAKGDEALQTKLEEVEKAKELILRQKEDELKQFKQEQAMEKIYGEIGSFVDSRDDINIPVTIKEAHNSVQMLRSKIGQVLGIKSENEVEKIYRSVVKGETGQSKELRFRLESKGAKFPDYLNDFLTVTELDDAIRGVKFNEVSGSYDNIALTFDDVYRLKNPNKALNKNVRSEVKGIYDKLNGKQNSANSVLDVDIVEVKDESSSMSYEQTKAILRTPLRDMKENPELAKKYIEACALIKAPVSDAVKRILK